MIALRFIYAANIFIAGWISITTIFFPEKAQFSIFEGAFAYSESFKLIGALWGGIFVISVIGLFYPKNMSLILFFQFVYKIGWLLFAALPAFTANQPYPKAMALFFLVWVVILPFIIPWKYLFEKV
jgi:hypothetical protein